MALDLNTTAHTIILNNLAGFHLLLHITIIFIKTVEDRGYTRTLTGNGNHQPRHTHSHPHLSPFVAAFNTFQLFIANTMYSVSIHII